MKGVKSHWQRFNSWKASIWNSRYSDTISWSAMIYRTSRFSNEKINYIKLSLKLIWGENGYFFIDNNNIEIRDL